MRVLKTLLLAAILGLTVLLVPDGTAAPTQFALVRFQHSSGVDVDPNLVWVLGVGSDARPGQNPLRSRGDALQLIGIDTRTGAATSIGIPRDSWVSIPGHGSNRINSALSSGGPQLLGEVVGNLVGIEPDYVFVTTFPGVERIAKDVGPITVQNPRPFADSYLKPKGFPQGKVVLKGYNVVAFGRIRHSLARGDFDRSANQQRVLRGFQRKVAQNAGRPGWIDKGVLSVMRNVHTDLSPAALFRLAQVAAQIDPHKVTGCVIQGHGTVIGGADVVIPDFAMAKRFGNEARHDATLEHC